VARRRQRIQEAKAAILADCVSLVEGYDVESMESTAEALGVTTADVVDAVDIVARQLTAWSIRITPKDDP
jgi:hypothetical protein